MVELGIQSFSAYTLKRSARNYSPETAKNACQEINNAGLSLGIQLLPGLPGSKQGDFQHDITETINAKPDAVRIYPCLIVKGTGLEKLYRAGKYEPWSLPYTEEEIAMALIRLWSNEIHVIRIGVAHEDGLAENIIAGPNHPALGQKARSQALYLHLCSRLAMLGSKPEHLTVPQKYSGEFWGHKGCLKNAYAALGIWPDMVSFNDKPCFKIN